MDNKDNITLETMCQFLAERIGPCPKCGYIPHVMAIFENNNSNEIIGYKVFCGCNVGDDGVITSKQFADLPLYSLDDLLNH